MAVNAYNVPCVSTLNVVGTTELFPIKRVSAYNSSKTGYIKCNTFNPSTGDMTIGMWICAFPTTNDGCIIAKRDNWTSLGDMYWHISRTATHIKWCWYGSERTASANAPLVWEYVTVTKSETTATFFQNGVSKGSGSITMGTKPTATIYIGNAGAQAEAYLGYFLDVTIYNRVLTTNEILYNMKSRFSPIHDGLQNHWPLNENALDKIHNSNGIFMGGMKLGYAPFYPPY